MVSALPLKQSFQKWNNITLISGMFCISIRFQKWKSLIPEPVNVVNSTGTVFQTKKIVIKQKQEKKR